MNFMQQVAGFLVNFSDWLAAGRPTRAPEWVAQIFKDHCEPCDQYEPNGRTIAGSRGKCAQCGCHVSSDPTDPLNKLIYPNLGCPLDPPKFEASIQVEFTTDNEEQNNDQST